MKVTLTKNLVFIRVRYDDLRPNAVFCTTNPTLAINDGLRSIPVVRVRDVDLTGQHVWVFGVNMGDAEKWIANEKQPATAVSSPANKPIPNNLGMWLINGRDSSFF